MRVLVFGITENPGGVESVIMNYYRKIDRAKYHFDFLCNTEEVAYEDEIQKLGGKIFRIAMRSKDRKKYYNDLDLFFKNNASNYDAIWINVCSLANIDYLKWAKKYGIKTRIIHSHNSQNMDSRLRGLLHRYNKLILNKYATSFWSCSQEASDWFFSKSIQNSPNYHLIRNGIDVEKYKFNQLVRNQKRKELHLDGKFVVGNVGRLHFQKNQIFLIEVFKEIKKIKNHAVLLLVGDGADKEKLIQKVKELQLDDSVLFLGLRKDVASLYSAMDVFVFPSLFEGLPLALVESQAASLPTFISEGCISTDAIMSNFIKSISLEEAKTVWAKEICSVNYDRESLSVEEIIENGYDINHEVQKLERYFEEA